MIAPMQIFGNKKNGFRNDPETVFHLNERQHQSIFTP